MFLYILLRTLSLSEDAISAAGELDFEIQGFGFDAQREEVRAQRIVRVGAIQNKIVIPTTAPILEQVCLINMLWKFYQANKIRIFFFYLKLRNFFLVHVVSLFLF